MSNELGNTPADKDYKPSGIVNDLAEGQVKAVQLADGTYITEKLAKSMTKAEERALETYPHYTAENITEVTNARRFFAKGYKQAEKDLADAAQFSSGLDGFFYGKGYEQAEKDTIVEVEKWLKANFHHRNCWNADEFCISLRTYFEIEK